MRITEKCSLFKPHLKADQWCMGTAPETVNIMDLLNTPFQHDLISKIREAATKDERSALKKQLWAFTPSAIMLGGRGVNHVVQHTGLMQFDIDGITDNLPEVFEAIKLIPYTLFCAKSAGGNGLWGLFRITNPELHSQHFDAMTAAFKAIGVKIDQAPRSIASLRFASYDENALFNAEAKMFDKRIEPIKQVRKRLVMDKQKRNDNLNSLDLIKQFNAECTAQQIDEVLTNFGFNFHSLSGKRYRYTRPGKDTRAGLSVDYHEDKRTLFSFSSEVPGLEHWKTDGSGWSCSPITALLLYGCGGKLPEHWAMAFKYIQSV